MKNTYYDYNQLFKKAIKEPTKENLSALGDWLEKYGDSCWNGECYLLEDGCSIRPVMEKISEEQHDICGWELEG